MSSTNIEGIQTIVGDVIISKDGNGDLGNLTVQGTLTAATISPETIIEYNYTSTITGTNQRSYVITHGLGTTSPSVTLTDNNGNIVIPSVEVISPNQVEITFGTAPQGQVFQVTIRK